MPLNKKHILTTKNLSKEEIDLILQTAETFEPYAQKEKQGDMMKGKILAALFYEPSTRTRLSFETAMRRMGGDVVSVPDINMSSIIKGETLYDTAKVISNFADIVAFRHKEAGSAEEFAKGSTVPVINAGDGPNQHPSQALLDLYTMKKEKGTLDGLTISMSGDLKYGRTVHSLAYLLAHYDVKLKFVAPKELAMTDEVKNFLSEKGVEFEETESIEEGIESSDILYHTRIQEERFEDKSEYEKLKGIYVLTRELVESKNPDLIILHPLPRVDEIAPDVDDLKGAAYFRQVQNGVAVRMALISMLVENS
ncbi:aspartate carbamoyltransferase [Patescibacteria group bacterium]